MTPATPAFWRKSGLKQSTKGIGPKTAAACLAFVLQFESQMEGEAAPIAGLAAFVRDSGTVRGLRHVTGGRRNLPASLQMAALSEMPSHLAIRDFAACLSGSAAWLRLP
ncbi:MAG: transposase [Rhodobacteraceae bacterium]|nr:transposase [Paracoccaceae bacterium]